MAGISLEKNESQEVVEENVCESSSREEDAVEAPKEVNSKFILSLEFSTT